MLIKIDIMDSLIGDSHVMKYYVKYVIQGSNPFNLAREPCVGVCVVSPRGYSHNNLNLPFVI